MPRILSVWSPNWPIATWRRKHASSSPAEAVTPHPPVAAQRAPPSGRGEKRLPLPKGEGEARAAQAAWEGEGLPTVNEPQPFALITTDRGARRLYALDAAAAALGLFVGQKATDALALVPELATEEADPEGDRASLEALVDWCVRVSPAVAADAPDGLLIDITGVAHLWGGERAMLDDVLARLARQGVPAHAAVAGSAGAAWALARFGEDRTVAPAREEAALLAALPVTALRLEPQTAAQLIRLGLARIGQLAALPRDQLARRFGAAVLTRLDQALAHAEEALVFRRPATPWFTRLAFADPISAPDDLARVSRDIADRLCARLTAEGQGAARFELAFHRLDGRAHRLTVGLSLPGRSPDAIARLFAPMLETVDPGFGIEVVTLAAERVEPLAERQIGLAQIGLQSIGEIAREDGVAPLVDRLANRLGEDRVWRAGAYPSHIPERTVVRQAPLAAPAAETWDPRRPRPVRLFARPEPIEAVIAMLPDDPPNAFRWRGQTRRVRRAEGPERLAEEWWRRPPGETEPAHVRDYYRVEDDTGARYWLFRAGLYGGDEHPKWWLHGLG